MMGTRPQTLYGVADSPVGLAAWLLDHGDGWGQPAAPVTSAVLGHTSHGHPAGDLTRDDVLDNITLYWLTNTGVSSARLYWENKARALQRRRRLRRGGRERLSRRELPSPAQLDRTGVSQPYLLQPARPRRPLRGLGTAATFLSRGPRRLQATAQIVEQGIPATEERSWRSAQASTRFTTSGSRCGSRPRCGLPCDELCAVSAVVQPAAPRYLVLTQHQARSHGAAGARFQQSLDSPGGHGNRQARPTSKSRFGAGFPG